MTGLLDLPVEVLEEIAYQTTGSRKAWSSGNQGTPASDELAYRLVHPFLTSAFTVAFFKDCTITVNPRDCSSVRSLRTFCRDQRVSRHVTSIELHAPNFLQRTHGLSQEVYQLLKQLNKLQKLNLKLDGHFVSLDELPRMDSLRHLVLQGESLYSQMQALSHLAPRLSHLDILSPALPGGPPSPPGSPTLDESAPVIPVVWINAEGLAQTEPLSHLTHLHISNVNTPAIQTLLIDLPYKPVFFSFSLLHNYDLPELASLLCRESFCQRTRSVVMTKSKLVAPNRLQDFRKVVETGLAGKRIKVVWTD